jgi:hypothetical protein
MEYRRNKERIVLRLDEGDEIIASLKAVCKKENVESAFVNGIGSAKKAEIAHFDTKEKKYNTKKFEGMLEIVSMNGNITLLDGEPAPHLHIAISRHDYSTISGHLMSAEIYPTCEIVIVPYNIRIERKFDEKTGINLQGF